MKTGFCLFLLAFTFVQCSSTQLLHYEIVIIGGGTSGTAAAIQAGRMGADVLLLQEQEWLGGMLTAAGVSATDGNHKLPSGIWGEFRDSLYARYGEAEALSTGWVSNTQFEPHMGAEIFNNMLTSLPNVRRIVGFKLEDARMKDIENGKERLISITFSTVSGEKKIIEADIFIEASEYGDLLEIAGIPYSHYMETREETGETSAPANEHPYVQDLTYVAILEDYSPLNAPKVSKPDSYDPAEFNCMCAELCSDSSQNPVSCDKMLDYGRLPNNKFMINWPNFGNDHYADLLEKEAVDREQILEEAKNTTLSWIYHLQVEGGYSHIGISKNEFPTKDGLALIPYIRESRRVKGIDRLYEYDLRDPYALKERPLYMSSIAVGDYPLDHHRKKNPVPKQIDFPSIPSYSVPYGALIPENVNGLLVAEKSISVSNVANGTTRLQPVVLQLGQAAGAAAVLSIESGVPPALLDVRSLQKALLESGVILMPYVDAIQDYWAFTSIQRIGLSGIMRGEGIPVAWANETRFYPENVVKHQELLEILLRTNNLYAEQINKAMSEVSLSEKTWTLKNGFELFESLSINSKTSTDIVMSNQIRAQQDRSNVYDRAMEFFKVHNIVQDSYLTRASLAVLIDYYLDPFSSKNVQIGYPNSRL
jgi:hypothetical protein